MTLHASRIDAATMPTATRQPEQDTQQAAEQRPRYSPTTSARTRTKVARMLTSPLRVLPDFIIIGAQRCGTTSLFEYLTQHPQIVTPLYKEVRYFTDRYWLGPMFYRACFPTRGQMRARSKDLGKRAFTFEATPNYLFNPAAINRIKQKLPHIKLVAILRDPIARAVSHYRFVKNIGWETLGFDEAIAAEPERMKRLPGESDAQYYDRPQIRRFSYALRGQYAPQLRHVIDVFGRDRLHVMCFESLVDNPKPEFDRLLDFVGLERYDGIQFAQYHPSKSTRPRMAPETLQYLEESFAPHNKALRDEFGDMFSWARGNEHNG